MEGEQMLNIKLACVNVRGGVVGSGEGDVMSTYVEGAAIVWGGVEVIGREGDLKDGE
jgi:hypothetical protein